MFACSSFVTFYKASLGRSDVKIAALLAFLLTPSTVLFAAAEDSHLQNADHSPEPVFVDRSAAVYTHSMAGNDAKQPTFSYPVWPERGEIKTGEMLPPPPPGPYMSSALSTYSFKGLSFEQEYDGLGAKGLADDIDPADSSIDVFSPDKPWPEFELTNRWMPDNGYQYVTPNERKSNAYKYSYTEIAPSKRYPQIDQNFTAGANRPVQNRYVYNDYNVPNPAASSARNLPQTNTYPVTNENPYATKAYAPYSRSESLYKDPVMNRYSSQAVPANRM